MLVDFGMGIRGLIPSLHLFDNAGVTSEFRAKMIKAKYSIDSKVDVRVLTCDPSTKRCVLTAKKSLVQAPDIISSYAGCKVGQTATGFISNIDDRGLSVTFFNKVYGRVTARSLALELGMNDHKENYKMGDVVQCRIAHVKKIRRGRRQKFNPESDNEEEESDHDESNDHLYYKLLTLSLRVTGSGGAEYDGERQQLENESRSRRVHLHAGAILPAKSMKIVSLVKGRDKGNGILVPGYAIVSIKSKYLVDEAEKATMLPYVECKLGYDQLLDEYDAEALESTADLDALGEKLLTPGEKLKCKGILLSDPRKSSYEFSCGTGNLTLLSIRPKLVKTAEAQLNDQKNKILLPNPHSHLFVGATVRGYVVRVDKRHGAFIRFLDRLTGLVPKFKNGLELPLFSTVEARIVSVDTMCSPPKILLSARSPEVIRKINSGDVAKTEQDTKLSQQEKNVIINKSPFHAGDIVTEAEIESIGFNRVIVKVLDEAWADHKIKASVHCTMAKRDSNSGEKIAAEKMNLDKGRSITKYHPFHQWSIGMKLKDLVIVSVETREGVHYVEFSNHSLGDVPEFIKTVDQIPPKSRVSGIVSKCAKSNDGIWLELSPKVHGFIPGVEIADDLDVLNNMAKHFHLGSSLECTVLDKGQWVKNRSRTRDRNYVRRDYMASNVVFLSLLCKSAGDADSTACKPVHGDLLVGRINRSLETFHPPALMMELRGGYVGRCCITELEEVDDWVNMPLGQDSEEETAVVSDDDVSHKKR